MCVRTVHYVSSKREAALFLAQSSRVPIDPEEIMRAMSERDLQRAVRRFDQEGEKTFNQLWRELRRCDVKMRWYEDLDIVSLFRIRAWVLIRTEDGWQLRETWRRYPRRGKVEKLKDYSISETCNRDQSLSQVDFRHSQERVNEDPAMTAVRGVWQELKLDIGIHDLIPWDPLSHPLELTESSVFAGTYTEGFVYIYDLILPTRPLRNGRIWKCQTIKDGGTFVHTEWIPYHR